MYKEIFTKFLIKFTTEKEYVKMSSGYLDKTVITDNWQIFSKKLLPHFIHHKEILKVTKFQFKIICRSRVLDKTSVEHCTRPGTNRVNNFRQKIKTTQLKLS